MYLLSNTCISYIDVSVNIRLSLKLLTKKCVGIIIDLCLTKNKLLLKYN